jgi:DNA-binding transcriptional LysR family regulator
VAEDLIDLREIAAIDSVAKMRSFMVAAEAINTTQPTLSRLIAAAEERLGVVLFRRGWSGAEATPAGDIAIRSSRAMLEAIGIAGERMFKDGRHRPPLWLNLKMSQLSVIEAVTRDCSVSLAAARLGRSQPDLSRTLSDFSKRFEIGLFQRTATGMQPLRPALTLTELAGNLRHQMTVLRMQLGSLEGVVLGRVSVGMLPFSGQDHISAAFARLSNLHPHIRLSCITGGYRGLVEALRRHEIDRIVGVLRGSDCPMGLEEEHLYDEHYRVVARHDHPLHATDCSPADLEATKWVVAPHGTPVRTHFEATFARLGITPPTQTCEMLSFTAAEQMLVESLSVAMLTYSDRRIARLRPELKVVQTGLPRVAAPVGLTRLKSAVSDAAIDEFDRIIRGLVRNVEE